MLYIIKFYSLNLVLKKIQTLVDYKSKNHTHRVRKGIESIYLAYTTVNLGKQNR